MFRYSYVVVLVAILALAAALRLPQLDVRPMHTDEAVHAEKLRELWETGRYVYDPEEYHGPTLYYAALPVLWICGDKSFTDFTETQLRVVPVIFGLGLIALLPLIADGLGRRATMIAGLLTAVSTAFVFYGRYYIQETLLVFFTFLTIGAGWRYVQSRKIAWAIMAGVGIGLMHATKETCIIALGCMTAALLSSVGPLRPTAAPTPDRRRTWKSDATAVLAGLIAATLVSVTFYSAFFTESGGPRKSILTYLTYFDRAGNHGLHDHSWHFYFERLLYFHRAAGPTWSEWPILLFALFGAIAAFRFQPKESNHKGTEAQRGENTGGSLSAPLCLSGSISFRRFIALFTLLMAVAYSAISYKTTWCVLGFLHGMILLAGLGVADVLDTLMNRIAAPSKHIRIARQVVAVAMLIVFGVGLAHLVRQTRVSDEKFYADNRNPYVYAHPVNDVKELAGWVDRLGAASPDGRRMLIRVFTPDARPLPWYLRRYENVGYWEKLPEDCDAPVVIAWPDFTDELDRRLGERYQVSHKGLRPGLVLTIYARRDIYDAFVAQQRK